MAQSTDQGAASTLRFPDIESISSVSDVKDWLRKFRFEMETGYRQLWRDSNKVFKTEIPGLVTSISTVINFDVPLPNGLNIRKSGSDVIWDTGTIDYGGTTYSIPSGSHTPGSEGGIYWDEGANVIAGQDDPVAVIDRWFIAHYDSSANVKATAAFVIVNGGLIQANTLHAANAIINGTLTAAQVLVSDITGNAFITPSNITVTSLNNNANWSDDQSPAEIRSASGWSHSSDATKIDGGTIYTNTVELVSLNFTPLVSAGTTGQIVATINASTEGIKIDADTIAISGATYFSAGYDPTEKVTSLGGSYDTAASGARVRIFPDANTGFQAINSVGSDVFVILVGGTDSGDIIIGNYTGNKGMKWDNSAGAFDVKGTFTATSIVLGDGTTNGTITFTHTNGGGDSAMMGGTVTGFDQLNATDNKSGFIFGIDDSDSDKTKLQFGNKDKKIEMVSGVTTMTGQWVDTANVVDEAISYSQVFYQTYAVKATVASVPRMIINKSWTCPADAGGAYRAKFNFHLSDIGVAGNWAFNAWIVPESSIVTKLTSPSITWRQRSSPSELRLDLPDGLEADADLTSSTKWWYVDGGLIASSYLLHPHGLNGSTLNDTGLTRFYWPEYDRPYDADTAQTPAKIALIDATPDYWFWNHTFRTGGYDPGSVYDQGTLANFLYREDYLFVAGTPYRIFVTAVKVRGGSGYEKGKADGYVELQHLKK